MLFLYTLVTTVVAQILRIVALFVPKINLFIEGRKNTFATIASKINATDKTIWFHAASLGEYEQGLPVIEAIKLKYPNHKIVVTFFSPSGFEVRKNNTVADATVYLPMDTKQNTMKFIDLIRPEMVFFIKYEFWPNYLNELKKRKIRTYLISGIFRENQLFFKWYGGFYRDALQAFDYFFVQNESSKKLLQSIGFQNIKISGDTRFDRVSKIVTQDNTLDFVTKFKNNTLTIVVGSSWPIDEAHLITFINSNTFALKVIIAPHNIKAEQIAVLQKSITKKAVLFSEKENKNLAEYDVMIVDTIGILTKIYSYADLAYVGGGFGKSGLHNILEPATFGIPIIIGPNYSKFSEAVALVNIGGCTSVKSKKELEDTLNLLIQNEDERYEKGHICSTFAQMNIGATNSIINHIIK